MLRVSVREAIKSRQVQKCLTHFLVRKKVGEKRRGALRECSWESDGETINGGLIQSEESLWVF